MAWQIKLISIEKILDFIENKKWKIKVKLENLEIKNEKPIHMISQTFNFNRH